MINYPYIKYEALIPEVFKSVKNKLTIAHANNILLGKAPINSKRKILEEDIKIIINEYFKDLAVWLEDPYTSIYCVGNIGTLKLQYNSIDNFLSNKLFPKYKVSKKELYKKRIAVLWKLRQLKYAKTNYKQKILEANQTRREPNYLYGDLFDLKLPSTTTKIKAKISDNLNRKQFLDILDN